LTKKFKKCQQRSSDNASWLGFVLFHLSVVQLINEKIIWLLAQSDTVTCQNIEFSL